MGPTSIRIRGAAELERAFLQLRRDVLKEIKPAIAAAAEAVRKDAEVRAVDEISNIGQQWSRMRVGATVTSVYIAPRRRRRGGSPRPNLAGLLLTKAMEPALDAHGDEALAAIELAVDAAAARNGFF